MCGYTTAKTSQIYRIRDKYIYAVKTGQHIRAVDHFIRAIMKLCALLKITLIVVHS